MPEDSEREQPKKKLKRFEGREVHSTTVAITNAGDGLSSAMKVEPIELHHGETVYLVLELEVSKVRFDPVKDTDGLQRVHVLRAGRATLIDGDVVKEALDEQEQRIEEALGVSRLNLLSDEQIDGLISAHESGLHDGITEDGCPSCEERNALAAHEDAAK